LCRNPERIAELPRPYDDGTLTAQSAKVKAAYHYSPATAQQKGLAQEAQIAHKSVKCGLTNKTVTVVSQIAILRST
jgi:hypothetical protein